MDVILIDDIRGYMTGFRILLSAYSCGPGQGSEPGVGWNWALALSRRGHEVFVVTRERNRAKIESVLHNCPEAARLNFIYHDIDWPKNYAASGPLANLAYSRWQASVMQLLYATHAHTPFDIAHHLTFGSWRQPSRIWRLGIPYVFGPVGGGEEAPSALTRHFGLKPRFAEIARAAWNRAALTSMELRRSVQFAASVPVKTSETADFIHRLGGSPQIASELGIDPARVVSHVRGRDAGGLRCIFVGRLIDWKGARLAIDAVARARQSSDITLSIVGDGKLAPDLRAQVMRMGLDSAITFHGAVPQADLFELYRQHDVFLFPSLHDSSGNVVLEAFASGLPVVCLALGGPGELVSPSNGIAVLARNLDWGSAIEGLSGALRSLAADEDRRQALAAGAIKTALDMSWDAAVARVYEPLELALAGSSRRQTAYAAP